MIPDKLKKLFSLNIVKTLYVNFYYFPFSTALKFPILIYRNVKLSRIAGKITINASVRSGLLAIGKRNIGTLDHKNVRSIWEVRGEVILDGKVSLGSGSRISVASDAVLRFGDNFSMTGNSSIVCQKNISFGNDCLLSWDILVMDSDFHKILNSQGETINAPSPIRIGNHVWIGCRSTILKGVQVADHSVIAAGAIITKTLPDTHSIYGGNNLKLKSNIDWRE